MLVVSAAAIDAAPLDALAHSGRYAVAQYEVVWHDAQRGRDVPARIYAPIGAPAPLHVIVFSHGFANSRAGYSYLGRQWASHGYVSIHPEHAGAAADVAALGIVRLYLAGFDHELWRRTAEDLRFVIDTIARDDALPPPLRGRLDVSHVGVAGHSLGAYAALALAGLHVRLDGHDVSFRDPRVVAAIPISMSENFSSGCYRDIAIPMLHITGTRDSSIFYGTTPRARRIPFESIPAGNQYLVTIDRANHSTFSDDESPRNAAAHDIIRLTTTLFWNAYLRGDPSSRDAMRTLEVPGSRVEKHGALPVIGRIDVKTEALFNEEESKKGAFYRGANLLQMRARPEIIRRLLTFREGELLDEAKLAESERILRGLDFLRTASITAGTPHDGTVDVTVTTQDEFTTGVSLDFANDGGRSLYDVSITQKNLFGTGAEASVRRAALRERSTTAIEFIDPVSLGGRWNVDALGAKSSDGHEERLAIARPMFSYETRWTGSLLLDRLQQDDRVYDAGAVDALFAQRHREAAFNTGLTLASTPTSTTRLIGGFDLIDDAFTPRAGTSAADRHFRFVVGGVDYTASRFITLDHVDFGMRPQDFDLGAHVSIDAARSARGGRPIWRLRSDDSYGVRLGDAAFATTHLSWTMRAGDTNRNAIWSSDTRFVARSNSVHPMTTVAALRADIGSDLDRDQQFFADGTTGLRAYPNFAFEGNRRVVVNVEERLALGREVLQMFEPGAALFVDSGEAVLNQPLHLHDFRTDAGIGLRLGLARYESTMLRLDFAWAFNASPLSRRGFVVSFATAQAF